MKKTFLMGTLLLGLAACGRNTPASSYPYNPDASATQSSDARTPYRGDWALFVTLADKTSRYGVVSVTTKIDDANVKNAGAGPSAWCVSATCTQPDEQGRVVIGSAMTTQGTFLTAAMIPTGGTSPRFVMTDVDGKVAVVDANGNPTTSGGKAVIAGEGVWFGGNGSPQAGVFVLTQVRVQPSAQQVAVAGMGAQRLLAGLDLGAQKVVPFGELRAAVSSALSR